MEFITTSMIALASMNMIHAVSSFVYNTEVAADDDTVKAQVVYRRSDDGKYLSHHLRYCYTYDEQQRLVRKEVLKWDSAAGGWRKSYCLNYTYEENGYSVSYAWWNAQKETYTEAVAKQTYDEQTEGVVYTTLYKRRASDGEWVIQGTNVMMHPGARLLAQTEEIDF